MHSLSELHQPQVPLEVQSPQVSDVPQASVLSQVQENQSQSLHSTSPEGPPGVPAMH